MLAGHGADGIVRKSRLFALASIQGIIGFVAFYVFSGLTPSFRRDPMFDSMAEAGSVSAAVQGGLMLAFVGWYASRRTLGRRGIAVLVALFAVGLLAMAAAGSVALVLAAAVVAGVGSLTWGAIQALIVAGAATRGQRSATLVQKLGVWMLLTGSAVRWGILMLADIWGWRAGLASLAVLAIAATAALCSSWFDKAEPASLVAQEERTVQRVEFGSEHRRIGRWSCVICALTGGSLAMLDSWEVTAMSDGFSWLVGPLGVVAYVLGGVAGLLIMAIRARGNAVILAAIATLFGALLDLFGELFLEGDAWIVALCIGRGAIEIGTTLMTLSLAAIVGERYGHGDRFARNNGFWRCLASTVMSLVSVLVYASGGWAAITLGAGILAALALVAVLIAVSRYLAGPVRQRPKSGSGRYVGRHRGAGRDRRPGCRRGRGQAVAAGPQK